jgi:hypothetical protein
MALLVKDLSDKTVIQSYVPRTKKNMKDNGWKPLSQNPNPKIDTL